MKRQLNFGGRNLLLAMFAFLFSPQVKAQLMITYKDAQGKIMTQAQVDALDKQYEGFLRVEFLSDDPLIVQVIPPSPEELKLIRELRDKETADLKKKWLGNTLPAFRFESLGKKKFGPEQLQGKKTVLFFWSRNDYGSLNQMAAYNQLAKANSSADTQFWAITFEDAVLVKEFLKKQPMHLEIMPNNFEFVMQDLAIMQTPILMITGPDVKVRYLSTSIQRDIDVIIRAELAKIN